MSKQLSADEQVELIIGATQLGKRANVRRNLIYVRTALGGTFIPVEEAEEGEVESNEANELL
jgi:hypothetical protein